MLNAKNKFVLNKPNSCAAKILLYPNWTKPDAKNYFPIFLRVLNRKFT